MRSSVFAALYAGMTTITRARSAIAAGAIPTPGGFATGAALLVAREDAEALAQRAGLLLDRLRSARVHQGFEDLALVRFLMTRNRLQDVENLAHQLRDLALGDDQVAACDGPRPWAAVGTQYLEELLPHLATGVHAVHGAH